MKKKYKIMQDSGLGEFKSLRGEMVVMNQDGIFFLVYGMNDYNTGIRKLSECIGNYTVIWKD